MKVGVVYVAFGETYLDQCMSSAGLLRRKVPDLSVRVLTNVPDVAGCDGITFTHLDLPRERCHRVKTQVYKYSPFDRTLFLDTDTAVRSSGVRLGFDLLDDFDVLFTPEVMWRSPAELRGKDYPIAENKIGYRYPLWVYNSGVMFFERCRGAYRLFDLWTRYFDELEIGRDQPSLAKAAQVCMDANDCTIGWLNDQWNFPHGTIVQHALGREEIDGLKTIPKYKPRKGTRDFREVK